MVAHYELVLSEIEIHVITCGKAEPKQRQPRIRILHPQPHNLVPEPEQPHLLYVVMVC